MKRLFFNARTEKALSEARTSTRKRGFTLIEVLVALAIFVVLMVVVFVPLTQATRFLAVGRTRADLQQAANATMSQLQRDFSRAIYIYPNDNLPGVTDKAPYSTDNGGFPYIQGGSPARNTSRIDMLLPETDSVTGAVKYPIKPAKYIVTYYARRFDSSQPYDAYDNPVVLIRAQYPYANADGSAASYTLQSPPGIATTINTGNGRYVSGATGNEWLQQSDTLATRSEPIYTQDACKDAVIGGFIPGNHAIVTPRNIALVTPNATWPMPTTLPATYNLIPNTSFTLTDTNGDGKIDQVQVSLTVTNFNRQVSGDGGNDKTKPISGNVNFQKFTLNQSFNCPNIR